MSTKYIVLSAENENSLEEKVNMKLKEGYSLQGGISHSIGYGIDWYAQAMIKEENDNAS